MTITLEPFNETYRGLRVPWIAQWTGEVLNTPLRKWEHGSDFGLQYADETPFDRELGALWMRTLTNRSGEPQFAQINVVRQREAMLNGLCQVCGLPTRGSWLTHEPEPRPNGRPFTTSIPPTCHDCIKIARTICPHLSKRESRRLLVRNYRPFAVYGDVLNRVGNKVIHTKGEIRLADTDKLHRVMGRQLTVELYDYRRLKD